MILQRPLLAAAALATLASATPSIARAGNQVTATYNTRTGLYCILDIRRDETDRAESPIFRKPCRNAGQWRAHGIRFEQPVPPARTPAGR